MMAHPSNKEGARVEDEAGQSFLAAAPSPALAIEANSEPTTEPFEVCEVLAIWEDLPKPLRAAILAIVRTYRADLFTNRGKEQSDWSGGSGSPRREATISGAGASESSNGSQSYRFREQVDSNP